MNQPLPGLQHHQWVSPKCRCCIPTSPTGPTRLQSVFPKGLSLPYTTGASLGCRTAACDKVPIYLQTCPNLSKLFCHFWNKVTSSNFSGAISLAN
jgi:hypothetical protein